MISKEKLPPPRLNGEKEEGKLMLPDDEEAHLSILFAASLYAMTEIYTKLVYEIKMYESQVQSLSKLPRGIEAANIRSLAAIKRTYGKIGWTPDDKTVKMPPNYVILAGIAVVAFGIIAYAQYNTAFSHQLVQFWNTWQAYIVILAFFVAAGLLMFVLGRRRSRS